MTRVLVLGASGMLGSMVLGYLRRSNALQVEGATRETFDAEAFVLGSPQRTAIDANFVVNCIGVIKPFCRDDDPVGVRRAVAVNALFPHRLAAVAQERGARVIQIATDCVYSGTKGQYIESDRHDALDVYGKSKSLGEVFNRTLLNVRCSIIGPELKSRVSLLEWFLGHEDGAHVRGFAHHRWNGVTTLQFAKLCERIITSQGLYDTLLSVSHVHHFLPNTSVTKCELLQQMNEVFGRHIVIEPTNDAGPAIDRTIATVHTNLAKVYPAKTMLEALRELARHMRDGTGRS